MGLLAAIVLGISYLSTLIFGLLYFAGKIIEELSGTTLPHD